MRRGIGTLALAGALVAVVVVGGGSGAMAGTRAKKQVEVTIKNFAYHKKTLHVGKGTKVVFRNKDHANHTATKRGVFNTGKIRHGQAKAIKFTRKGSFKYICLIHPGMHGKIVVG